MKVNGEILALLERNASVHGEKVAIYDGDLRITWREMYSSISQMASILENITQTVNAKQKNRIVVSGDGGLAHCLLVIALFLARITYIPQNRTLTRSKVKDEFSDILFIKAESKIASIMVNNCEISSIYVDALSTISYEPLEPTNEDFPAAFFFTSGTTDMPKIIVSSISNVLKGGIFVAEALKIKHSDIIAGTLQLDFDYGINQLVCTLLNALTYVCCPFSSSKRKWISEVIKYKVTIVPAMPFLIEKYFVQQVATSTNHSVRLVTSSGAPFTKFHFEKVQGLFESAKVSPMYGLSEGFRATILDSRDYLCKPSSVGKPIGDTEIAIINPDGEFLQAFEKGEIIQSKGCLTWGYLNDPIATEKKFIHFADFPNRIWLRSGDIGYLDDQGYLFVTGRIESQIKRFGIRISIDEVENAIKAINGVRGAVVIPREVNQTESEFDLAVELVNISEMQFGLLLRKLPLEFQPRKIKYFNDLPSNYNGGKPDRARIRMILDGD